MCSECSINNSMIFPNLSYYLTHTWGVGEMDFCLSHGYLRVSNWNSNVEWSWFLIPNCYSLHHCTPFKFKRGYVFPLNILIPSSCFYLLLDSADNKSNLRKGFTGFNLFSIYFSVQVQWLILRINKSLASLANDPSKQNGFLLNVNSLKY